MIFHQTYFEPVIRMYAPGIYIQTFADISYPLAPGRRSAKNSEYKYYEDDAYDFMGKYEYSIKSCWGKELT